MKLGKKKVIDYDKILSDEKISENKKRRNKFGLLTSLLAIGSIAYYKYDNLVINDELSIRQQIVDNASLAFAKMGNEFLPLGGVVLAFAFIYAEYAMMKDVVNYKKLINKNKENGNFVFTKKSKIIANKIKKTALNLGSYLFAGLAYLATTANISFNISQENVVSVLLSNVNWAFEGALNEPVIFSIFALPAMVLHHLAYKTEIKIMAMNVQNKAIMQDVSQKDSFNSVQGNMVIAKPVKYRGNQK